MISPRNILTIALTIVILGITAFWYVDDIYVTIYSASGNGVRYFDYLKQEQLQSPELQKEAQSKVASSQMFDFRIRSFNVRVDTRNRFPHEHHWRERKQGVVESLLDLDDSIPTIFGLQELKHHQLNDILIGLNGNSKTESPWKHYGVGRDDGKLAGEYTPIIYNSKEWILLNGTSRWLSASPSEPIKSWGAATKRIITFTTLQNIKLGNMINFINTHLDHKSMRAKRKSAKLIIDWIEAIPNEYPTFLSGDFNSLSSGFAYQLISSTMEDANLVAVSHSTDTNITYTGFEEDQKETTIDFLWSKSSSDTFVKVGNFATLTNIDSNGILFSDHRPIEAEFQVTINLSIQE